MAFCDFTFPKVEQVLGLHLRDADLFSSAPECPVRESIAEVASAIASHGENPVHQGVGSEASR
jgi:hypothetical protein